MNSPRTVYETLRIALLTALVLLISIQDRPSLASSEAIHELEMTMRVDPGGESPSKVPKFRVELRNVGDHDLILNLGMMLANGRRQYADAIVLTILDPHGRTRKFQLKGPGFIAGRVDPLIVPLPVASTFSVPVDLDNYWTASSQEPDYRFEHGAYSLEAQFSGRGLSQQDANLDVKGLALMPYWMGSVSSNRLQFEVAK